MEIEVGFPDVGQDVAAIAGTKSVVHNVGSLPADAVGVPAIGVQRRPAVVLVERTMVGVRTAFGDEHDMSAAPQA